jgi:hypothetical protein
MWYEVTGLVPARIEVRSGKRLDMKPSDLDPTEVTAYMKESKLKKYLRHASYPPRPATWS